jgi:DNA-binding NarL/FixJ family response regulator
MNPIRILIADDHPMFRFGLRVLLEIEEGMVVVGETGDGAEAVAMAAELRPDVVLMDINLPGLNGIEATRQIVQDRPETAVLIVTMLDDDTVFAAMRAGARGYLLKGAEGEETIRAVRAVAHGEAIFSPGAAEKMVAYFSHGGQAAVPEPFPELTPREREILLLVGQGLANKAIAEKLFLSPKTVRNQVSTIISKLQADGRNQLMVLAREAGLSTNS